MGCSNIVRKNHRALLNVRDIKNLRTRKGLSVPQLAEISGLSEKSIYYYETLDRIPSVNSYNSLAEALGWDEIKKPAPKISKHSKKKKSVEKKKKSYDAVPIPDEKPVPNCKPPAFDFVIGKCYKIFTASPYANNERHSQGTVWDKSFTLRYEGKQGIHHVFREVIGGWITTRTDQQLIGKKIMEVAS